jgi:16S rRNA (uracil1498-N3)-methyltransferase
VNLILLEPSEVAGDGTASLSGARAEHVRDVLGAAPGATIRVGVVNGPVGTASVSALSDGRVALQCTFAGTIPERPRVDLLLALPRPKVVRRLWAPLAALGLGQVILTNAGKVERDYFGSHLLQEDTYTPLLLEGLQQARDTRVPVVSVHRRLKVLVEDDLDRLFPAGRRIVAHPGGGAEGERSVGVTLAGVGAADRVLVAVGPEGGWSEFELALLERHGFARVGMGPRTLATSTACIALLALVHDALRHGAGSEAQTPNQ